MDRFPGEITVPVPACKRPVPVLHGTVRRISHRLAFRHPYFDTVVSDIIHTLEIRFLNITFDETFRLFIQNQINVDRTRHDGIKIHILTKCKRGKIQRLRHAGAAGASGCVAGPDAGTAGGVAGLDAGAAGAATGAVGPDAGAFSAFAGDDGSAAADAGAAAVSAGDVGPSLEIADTLIKMVETGHLRNFDRAKIQSLPARNVIIILIKQGRMECRAFRHDAEQSSASLRFMEGHPHQILRLNDRHDRHIRLRHKAVQRFHKRAVHIEPEERKGGVGRQKDMRDLQGFSRFSIEIQDIVRIIVELIIPVELHAGIARVKGNAVTVFPPCIHRQVLCNCVRCSHRLCAVQIIAPAVKDHIVIQEQDCVSLYPGVDDGEQVFAGVTLQSDPAAFVSGLLIEIRSLGKIQMELMRPGPDTVIDRPVRRIETISDPDLRFRRILVPAVSQKLRVIVTPEVVEGILVKLAFPALFELQLNLLRAALEIIDHGDRYHRKIAGDEVCVSCGRDPVSVYFLSGILVIPGVKNVIFCGRIIKIHRAPRHHVLRPRAIMIISAGRIHREHHKVAPDRIQVRILLHDQDLIKDRAALLRIRIAAPAVDPLVPICKVKCILGGQVHLFPGRRILYNCLRIGRSVIFMECNGICVLPHGSVTYIFCRRGIVSAPHL